MVEWLAMLSSTLITAVMRLLPVIFIALFGSVLAADSPEKHFYPLWDGKESIADYAKRVNIPPTRFLPVGDGVELEMVLIPAGKFVMGTPKPELVGEDEYRSKILWSETLFIGSITALLLFAAFIAIQAIRRRRKPQVSLALLLGLTVLAGTAVLSGLCWQQSARNLSKSIHDYVFNKMIFNQLPNDEKSSHIVTITKPFYIGKVLVTQQQWQRVMGWNRSLFKGRDNPVETVSQADAMDFCEMLSDKNNLTVRLPSEAEWEYCCQAGSEPTYYYYKDSDLERVAWFVGNSNGKTHPVGQKLPNMFGLYDMQGNVWQWCQDHYGDDYYSHSPTDDPQGPTEGTTRAVMRGGSWQTSASLCRAASREKRPFNFCDNAIGFRVVAEPGSVPRRLR